MEIWGLIVSIGVLSGRQTTSGRVAASGEKQDLGIFMSRGGGWFNGYSTRGRHRQSAGALVVWW
jgi:hypothetical protein